MHKTEKEAEESRMKFMYSYLRDITLAMFIIVTPLCMRGTAYLFPKKGARSSKVIAKDDPGTLLSKTPDDASSYPSGAACNDPRFGFF
jgi:hypothetical protein